MQIKELLESLLFESATLTKGSARVMANKGLVADLAEMIRMDSEMYPNNFPAGFAKQAQKAPDQNLAEWFLEQLDRIEKAGYGGIVYSRDGVNSEWIVRRYIAGSHNWEDLEGTLNMNLLKWYTLKNRNLLDTNHADLWKFNSIRDVGRYMVRHYDQALKDLEEKLAAAAKKKASKAIKLVDNDDYKIYIVLNRAASCMYGMGSNWCTANSEYAGHFHNYAGQAMLFQLYPTEPEEVDKVGFGGKRIQGKERYQFSADAGYSFMDLADVRADSNMIRERFPYLFTDIANALTAKQGEIEQAMDALSKDPTLQSDDLKIKTYSIPKEIEKLAKFREEGHGSYFTNQVRPKLKKIDQEDPERSHPSA